MPKSKCNLNCCCDNECDCCFSAYLRGELEVPPVKSKADGKFFMCFNEEKTYVEYKLKVCQLGCVIGVHLHCGLTGETGDIVLPIIGNPLLDLPGIAGKGVIAKGVFRQDDLVGPLAGLTLEDLCDKITSGEIYVNVHTVKYPMGEIRGQVN